MLARHAMRQPSRAATARLARVCTSNVTRRTLCAAPKEEPPKADETYAEKFDKQLATQLQLPGFVDETLRGVGQVIFLNSPSAGAGVLAALLVGDPWLGALAALGTAEPPCGTRGEDPARAHARLSKAALAPFPSRVYV